MSTLPLSGVRVLDFTHQVAGPFCTMVLADLGAEVVKVERYPGGDQARSWPVMGPSVFLALNRNKKSIAVDLTHPKARQVITSLVKWCQVFVENYTPGTMEKFGLGFRHVAALNAAVVYCSIWGYAPDSPFHDQPAWDPVIQARSGLMMTIGEENGPPMRIGASVVDESTGLYAAAAILAALRTAEKNQKPQRIVIPLFTSALSLMSFWITRYSLTGENPPRMGTAYAAFAPYRAYATQTGYVFLAASNNEFWRSLCEALSRPDLIGDPRFRNPEDRLKNRGLLDDELAGEISKWNRDELLRELERRRLPCAPVNNVSDLHVEPYIYELAEQSVPLNDGQRKFHAPISPVMFDAKTNPRLETPPTVGQHTEQILLELGFTQSDVRGLLDEGVVGEGH